jgi:putative DNA primase/helicase
VLELHPGGVGMTLLEAALALHEAGLCVLPAAEDGSKRPAVDWKEFQSQRPNVAQVRRWFSGSRTGLGVVCGAVSGGLEMCELEGRAVREDALPRLAEAAIAAGDAELWARVAAGLVVASPSGGVHFLYRLADVAVPGNTKLAQRISAKSEANPTGVETLAETRGEGGWVVTAPSSGSVHPSGGAWVVLAGSAASIPVLSAEERERLHGLVRTLDERPALAAAPPSVFSQPRSGSGDGVSPGDDYTEKTSWPEVLEPAGWRPVFSRGPVTYWRRPGKRSGISATTGYGEGDWLYVFSSSTEFEPERTYTRFGAFALLEHGGDHAAAAKALQAQGFGKAATKSHLELVVPPLPIATEGAAVDGSVALAPAPVPLIGAFDHTDHGNAALVVARLQQELRYVPERGAWLRWDGHRWAVDALDRHVQLVAATLREAAAAADEQGRRHYMRSLSRRGIEAAIALARTDPAMATSITELDADPHLLCTPGGVVDLRTGLMTPPEPAQLHTRSTSVTPDPACPTPRWSKFLADTFGSDAEIAGYVQRLAGYSSSGVVGEHILPFCYGAEGMNGKSVLMRVLAGALGSYAGSAPGSFLVAGPSQHETEIARLAGLRFVVCSEIEQNARFAEAKVKMLTGGDRLIARFMRRDHFEFDPTAKLWLMANHRPEVAAGGHSFWRRLRLIEFPHVVPAEERIADLDAILLREEGPGILAWIVAGARDYFAGGLREPAGVRAATAEYAESEDDLGRFVAERLVVASPEARAHVLIDTATVTASYASWCRSEGVEAMSMKGFGSQLRARWHIEQRRSHGRRYYVGLSLAAEESPTFLQPSLL